MDLTMVAALKAIFDTGTVSKAAKVLGVSQPSVSQSLRRLRRYFDDELFVRSGNALQPTPRAIALQPTVSRLMRDLDAISRPPGGFDPRTAHLEFIICMSEMAEYIVLPRLAAAFAEEAPGCSIRGVRVPQSRLLAALEQGEVDLAAGNLIGADASLRQQGLGEHRLVGLVSATSRWARVPLTRQGYMEARHVAIHRMTDSEDPVAERLRAKGIHRSVALSVSNDFVAARAVAETDLVCTASTSVGRHLAALFPVEQRPLPFDLEPLPTRMIWHARFQRDMRHVWLRQKVEAAYRAAIG
ncbi:LysR family transcriptional regulator [Pseudorhodoferax sp.]|uniref:LysR family transcriptional regulator n=1 Tax=Pseudorhodoferax sp. TaxID=1993553 RepID=UPI0039E5F3F1